jgi:hypothetical protein
MKANKLKLISCIIATSTMATAIISGTVSIVSANETTGMNEARSFEEDENDSCVSSDQDTSFDLENSVTFINSEEDIEKQEENQLAEHLKEAKEYMGINPKLRYVDVTQTKIGESTKTVSFYPTGQPSGGTRFASGGGFYYADNNSGSFTFSIGIAGVSTNITIPTGALGSAASAGYYCKAPNKTDHFKLKISRKYKIIKYAVYGRDNGNSSKKFLYNVYSKIVLEQTLSAVKV